MQEMICETVTVFLLETKNRRVDFLQHTINVGRIIRVDT